MGVDLTALRALFMAKRLNLVDFSRVVTLGRHEIFFSKEEYDYVKRRTRLNIPYNDSFVPASFQEDLLIALGAKEVESIDASPYEGASVIHNFNEAIPIGLSNKFSLFLDFGSIEHIFDVKQVISNVGILLEIGGHAIILTDSNGNDGHGLYQFSPEFFYSAFSASNGFEDTVVLLINGGYSRKWRIVKPPQLARGRVGIPSGTQYYAMCLTRKCAGAKKIVVEQSDYIADAWNQSDHHHVNRVPKPYFAYFRAIHIFSYLLLRSIFYSIKRKWKFKDLVYPFDPESAACGPYDKLISLWR